MNVLDYLQVYLKRNCCNMSVKLVFEIGHTASRKKVLKDGFTHDWELFVRGPDNSDISHYVDKVVFNLHDSFPKPKRGELSNE